MISLTQLRNSLRFRKSPPVAVTRRFDADAPTREMERAPELPPISDRMVRCSGQRLRSLRYEGEFYAALKR